jgi:hypothetical protein
MKLIKSKTKPMLGIIHEKIIISKQKENIRKGFFLFRCFIFLLGLVIGRLGNIAKNAGQPWGWHRKERGGKILRLCRYIPSFNQFNKNDVIFMNKEFKA